ncbi:hypothetical protein [Pseudarthrobacter sp. BIM B-2242]|uniref:hypothetical protein n=1 Tax=Pseudarthrobacter sp. BIM B-2242 TaxID=2772401 RepID=UPI00168BB112|nr:hypothetical protein [Pseudarthrobacter sp. BIM B-2242]QOD05700.1 hypothetical protein IDT60_21900 [Pseudarthrobacter sp. BIM B-2242]
MSTRQILQLTILAAALVLGFVPDTFNGLSVLAILLAGSALLLQPGVFANRRRHVLYLVK